MPLLVVPYVLIGEVVYHRGRRSFVRLGERVVGVFVPSVRYRAVITVSLAVLLCTEDVGLVCLRWSGLREHVNSWVKNGWSLLS
jgi:ABC-type uncharacterized transport system permease subunit